MTNRLDTIRYEIERQKVIPVLRASTYRDPLGIASALTENSFRVMEFTLTADNALDAISKARGVSGATAGCGTVASEVEARAARDAGAHFIVAPALLSEVAKATALPTMLAGLTPTELQEAARLTGWLVKLFPAVPAGPDYVRSVATVFPHLQIVTTGGILADNAQDFMKAGATAVASSYPGLVNGHLEPLTVAAGMRELRESVDRIGRAVPTPLARPITRTDPE